MITVEMMRKAQYLADLVGSQRLPKASDLGADWLAGMLRENLVALCPLASGGSVVHLTHAGRSVAGG